MKDGFVFYRSFAEAMSELDAQTKADVLDILCAYALDGIEPASKGIAAALFKLMKPQIDANNRRYENGKKGGRPKTTTEPEENQTETKNNQSETKAEPVQRSAEPKEKDKVKEKDKDKDKEKVKDIKHKHGEYKHVLLTDDQYNRLLDEFGFYTDDAIRIVDEYCQTSGKRYNDYNLVIRKWGIEEAKKRKKKEDRASPYNMDELERLLVNRV